MHLMRAQPGGCALIRGKTKPAHGTGGPITPDRMRPPTRKTEGRLTMHPAPGVQPTRGLTTCVIPLVRLRPLAAPGRPSPVSGMTLAQSPSPVRSTRVHRTHPDDHPARQHHDRTPPPSGPGWRAPWGDGRGALGVCTKPRRKVHGRRRKRADKAWCVAYLCGHAGAKRPPPLVTGAARCATPDEGPDKPPLFFLPSSLLFVDTM